MKIEIPQKITIVSLLNNLYVFAVGLYVFSTVVTVGANYSGIANISRLFYLLSNYLAYWLLVSVSIVNIIIDYKWPKTKIYYALLASIVVFLMCILGNSTLLFPFIVILGFPKELNLHQIMREYFGSILLAVIVVLLGCCIGIFGDVSMAAVGTHNTVRHSWGFTTPNTLGNYIAIILGGYICIYWEKWDLKKTAFGLIVLAIMWNYQNSRGAFFYGILIVTLMTLFNMKLLNKKIVRAIMWLPIILFSLELIITIFAMIHFSKTQDSLYNLFDTMFSGRLLYITKFYNMYGLSFSGHEIQTISMSMVRASNGTLAWLGLDSSFAYIAINDGILGIIVYCMVFFFANLKVVKDDNWGGALFLLLMVLMGLSENYMRSIYMNFTFFFFASYIANVKTRSSNLQAL
ncbi:hypothetical protein [Lactobacillus delbrueckii]|uniref:hypothetical protein n=1 Tax=Lactobacillus delbrueckii TaxID=1584 RepID=UPI001E603D30|nr:hypothetical protein [Lactobacillus delbrueckii]MCD5452217.1 hypothetical protein [Lactobacillus delbrueckii subsp. lactis]